MTTECKDCKHFNPTEYDRPDMGWCDLMLPPWLYAVLVADPDRKVHETDSCSFFKGWKQ